MAKDMYRVMVKNMSLCCLPVKRRLQQPTFSFPSPGNEKNYLTNCHNDTITYIIYEK